MTSKLDTLLKEELRGLAPGEIRFDEPMSRHTSFRIGGPADAWVRVKDVDSLARLLAWCRKSRLPTTFVGGGCNLLVRDGGVPGVVVTLGEGFREIRLLPASGEEEGRTLAISPEPLTEFLADAVTRFEDSEGAVRSEALESSDSLSKEPARVWVGAGAAVPALLKFATRRGLGGVEGLAGVPGSVGGSLMMNAGTREGELCALVESLDWLTPRGKVERIPQASLRYEYRHLHVPEGVFILSCVLSLKPRQVADIKRDIEALVSYRKSTQPGAVPSAGCVFKNPPRGDPAGKLIDQLGMKGIRIRGARISEVHANYVVNEGGATAKDVLLLMEYVRDRVRKEAGVELADEVRIIGRDRR